MKYLLLFNSIILSILLINCNPAKPKIKVGLGGFKPGKYCYQAKFEKDSASLKLEIDKYGNVTGTLYINYGDTKTVTDKRQPTDGDIKGEFRGDTLFADYNFKSGPKGKTLYSNPIALLHKGDSVIMGSGRIMSYLGRNYLDDKTPIDFDKSRFRFKMGECK